VHNGARELHHNDAIIIDAIIQLINTRLMCNPTLITFLKNLDAAVEQWQRLSENEFAAIIKNSVLLVSIDEILSFIKILKIVNGWDDTVLTIKRLNALLKSIELDTSKTPLQLWERRNHLVRLYEVLQYQAATSLERKNYIKKSARIQKNIKTIFAALEITSEYAVVLKRVECGGHWQGKLYELFEDAFCGETGNLSLATYARYIEKCVRQNEKIFGRRLNFLD